MVQYRGIEGNGVDQFRDPARYIILYPPDFKSGDLVVPYR
jgi:branched-chain amino acid transport system substrate-binding protein